jgi:hypothetical protein
LAVKYNKYLQLGGIMAKTFKDFLKEAPVGDYQTFGNFDKSHSFRHATDRKMVSSEKAIRNVRNKFGKTPYNFNLYFVNKPGASKFLEYGKVNNDWVAKNLGKDVAQAIQNGKEADDSINIIYTNNSAADRVPMTPWTMAHRFSHAVDRINGSGGQNYAYREFQKHLHDQMEQIMQYYSSNFSLKRDYSSYGERTKRNEQAAVYLFNFMGNFKSARDKNIRNMQEITHELLAQYIITGKITFRPLPQCFGGGAFGNKQNFCCKKEDLEEVHQLQDTLTRDLEMFLDDLLGSAVGGVYVM